MKNLLLLLPIIGALVLSGCSGSAEETADSIRLVPVEVVEIDQLEAYPVEERYVGKVEARRRSELAFEIAGTVEVVHFEEGEAVNAGDELARIDTARLDARKAELEAAQRQAEATLTLARSTEARFLALADTGAVAQQERDDAIEKRATAEAALDRIGAQLESIAVDLEKSVLRAPFEGTLVARRVDEGAVVSPEARVFALLETGTLEVRAALAAEAASHLSVGDELPVDFTDGSTRTMLIDRIVPTRDPRTRTIDVILSPQASAPLPARDGDLVTVPMIRTVGERGILLPRDSLTEGVRGLWACHVAVPDSESGEDVHRLDQRSVELIHAYADVVYARGPLAAGELVLAGGLHKIAPGQRVSIASKRSAPTFPDERTDSEIQPLAAE